MSNMNKKSFTFIYTNPETRETYRFRHHEDGHISTVAFLGHKTPKGKLIKKIGSEHVERVAKKRKSKKSVFDMGSLW